MGQFNVLQRKIIAGSNGSQSSSVANVYSLSHEHANKIVLDQITQSYLDVLSHFSVIDGSVRVDTTFWSEKEVSAYGAGTGAGGGAVGSLGGLANVGLWADEVPASDRIMVQLAGATHWSSKLLSEIVGLDTVALGAYLVANSYAKQSYVDARVAELVGTAPSTLDTLNELAAALGNDPNFATSITTLIGTKWTQDNAKIANWDSAYNALHSHANKTELDGITSTLISNWNLAFTNNHTHPNKTIIDSLTQANLDVLAKLSIVDGNLKVDTNLWSTGEVSAYGAGSGSGGGTGLISSVLGSAGLGGSYLDSDFTNTFNAYTINLINSNLTSAVGRIGALETSTPNVAWGTTTGQYVPLSINGVSKNLSLDGHTHSYLPLSGGNLTGALTINGSTVWHEGNDGAGSGLDAGLLCGRSAEFFFKSRIGYLGNINDQSLLADNSSCYWAPNTTGNPNNGYGILLNISDNTAWYNQFGFGTDNKIYFRQSINSATNFGAWKTLAFTDSNVASASKLANTRTIWGQNFNGEGNVSGAITGATTGSFSSTISATTGIFSNLTANYMPKHTAGGLTNSLIYDNGTNVGIGTTSPQFKLDINGTSRIFGSLHLNSEGLLQLYNSNNTSTISLSHNNASSKLDIYNRTLGNWANVEAGFLTCDTITMKNNLSEKFIRSNAWGGAIRLRANSGAATDRGLQLGRVDNNLAFTSFMAFNGDSGNVSINSTADYGYKLDVNGTGRFTDYLSASRVITGYDSGYAGSVSCSNWFRSSGATGWYSQAYGGGIYMEDATYVKVYGNKSFWVSGNIVATGEVTAYSASDVRLKTDVTTLKDSLRIIELLNPVSYKWNSIAKELNPLKDNNTDYGLIAQELECVMPELVHTVYGQYKSVDYVKIIPHLICAIKQLKMEVDHLKKTYY